LKAELERNPRLDAVFSICKELCIDDPIHWMNNTSPLVVDWWIAYLMLKNEREEAVHSGSGGSGSMTGEDAFAHLSNITGIKNVE
jgi:hypothetical protein